jgi:RimJ/RimL family protein N-acetyltransferase
MLKLVPTSQPDLSLVVACESDDETSPFIIPWTAERHLEALSDPDCAHLSLRDAQTNDWLGFVMLFGLCSPHRAIELRRIVCARKGAGIGRAAVRKVVELAFRSLQAHRLWLDVKSTNARARHLYLSEGFREEGVLRECLLGKDGYESLVIMSMLSSDPPHHGQQVHNTPKP